MPAYEVPLKPKAESFTIDLAGRECKLTTRWCPPLNAWTLDVDNIDGTPIIRGMPVVTGVDLLSQHAYLGLPGGLVAQTLGDVDTPPTFANFGVSGLLFFVTP